MSAPSFRAPWRSPSDNTWSWSTLWLNLAAAITCARFLVGQGVSWGAWAWTPGDMDAALPGAILAALGAIYYGRRRQEGGLPPSESP